MNPTKYLYALGIAYLMLSVTISCKKSIQKVETEYLTDAIEQAEVENDFQWVVVLPGLGCHGCIQEAEAFMGNNIENREILFVLTNISSLKILQQKIGIQIKERPNVYVDREDRFSIPTNNSIYPCIVRLKNGKVAGYEFQSPKNGVAFRKLQSLILTQ